MLHSIISYIIILFISKTEHVMEKIIKVKQETHNAIKIAAAKEDMTMKNFLDYLIKKHNEEKDNEQRD